MAADELENENPFPATNSHDEAPVNEHPWWTKSISEILTELFTPKGKK